MNDIELANQYTQSKLQPVLMNQGQSVWRFLCEL